MRKAQRSWARGTGAGQARRARDCGFTLIEMLFVSGITVITLSLLAGSVFGLNRLVLESKDREQATHYLTSVLEQVRGSDSAALLAYRPPPPENLGKDAAPRVEIVDAAGHVTPLPASGRQFAAPLPKPLTVRATIAWTGERGTKRSAAMTTLWGN